MYAIRSYYELKRGEADQCPPTSLQGQVFRRERDYLRTVQDEYLYHDYLVDENRPVYVQQFMQRAENHGLLV